MRRLPFRLPFSLGFAILVFSNFVPIIFLGLCTAFTMVVALLGDLFVLPALLSVFSPNATAKLAEE